MVSIESFDPFDTSAIPHIESGYDRVLRFKDAEEFALFQLIAKSRSAYRSARLLEPFANDDYLSALSPTVSGLYSNTEWIKSNILLIEEFADTNYEYSGITDPQERLAKREQAAAMAVECLRENEIFEIVKDLDLEIASLGGAE